MHHHRPVEFVRDDRFLISAKIIAELRRVAMLVEHLDGVFVADARERCLYIFQPRGVTFQRFELGRLIFQYRLHHRADQPLAERHHVIERRVCRFRLQHPEFRQVTPRLRFFRAKRRPKCVHLAQCHGRRFDIQLPGLRQVSLLVIDVVHFKERRRSFARRWRKHWRIRQCIALAIHEVACRANCFCPNPQNCCLPRCADPQMPVIQQKIHAVFFQLNREWRFFRDFLQHLHRRHADLVATRSSLF